jgi:hypothetical protein
MSLTVDLRETHYEDVNWNELTQDRVQWWDPVITVMNFLISK